MLPEVEALLQAGVLMGLGSGMGFASCLFIGEKDGGSCVSDGKFLINYWSLCGRTSLSEKAEKLKG
jgi:hypothetical protein